MKSSSNSRFDVYEAITNQIITAIEGGAGEVQLPWHRKGSAIYRPLNIASGKAYRGVNTVALWAAADAKQYAQGIWGTYRQWQERDAQVRKGEKSSLVIFYKELDSGEASSAGDEESGNRRFVARASRVFNIAQVDGYSLPEQDDDEDRIDPCEAAEHFVSATSAKITVGGDSAFYRPSTDTITMPDRHRFTGTETSSATEGWYSTLLHELTHWSGASHRMDRAFGQRFGDDAYAMEEMVAELGAAFLCGDLGITAEPRPDHAAYIDHWLRILKDDRKAIFTAASAANKAAEYLASLASNERREAA
ncbi:MAG: zincin-like metallopeptidase domain-containing protein [Altererythrobacter sp.]